jgi:hypothetical protein
MKQKVEEFIESKSYVVVYKNGSQVQYLTKWLYDEAVDEFNKAPDAVKMFCQEILCRKTIHMEK